MLNCRTVKAVTLYVLSITSPPWISFRSHPPSSPAANVLKYCINISNSYWYAGFVSFCFLFFWTLLTLVSLFFIYVIYKGLYTHAPHPRHEWVQQNFLFWILPSSLVFGPSSFLFPKLNYAFEGIFVYPTQNFKLLFSGQFYDYLPYLAPRNESCQCSYKNH